MKAEVSSGLKDKMIQVSFRADMDLPWGKNTHRAEKLKVWLDFQGLRKNHLEWKFMDLC